MLGVGTVGVGRLTIISHSTSFSNSDYDFDFGYTPQDCYDLFHEIVMECIPDRFRYMIGEAIKNLSPHSKEGSTDKEQKTDITSFIDDFNLEILRNNDSNKEPPF